MKLVKKIQAKPVKWDKKQVLAWFGDRGMQVEDSQLKAWHWEAGKLWFVILSGIGEDWIDQAMDTEPGMADMTCTHDEEGRPVLFYELYDSVPIDQSPLKGVTCGHS